MEFWEILTQIMREQNLTVAQVAKRCGIPDSTVRSVIDRKYKKIKLDVAFKLSAGLGVSMERLTRDSEREPEEGANTDWLDAFNRLREKSGLSLNELCEKSGVPKGTLSKISAGITKKPSIDTMMALVHAMGYTLGDLDDNKKAATIDSDGLDDLDLQFVGVIQQLNQDEKVMFLAQMKAVIELKKT